MKKIMAFILIFTTIAIGSGFCGYAEPAESYDQVLMEGTESDVVFEKGIVLEVENLISEGDYAYDYQLASVSIQTGEYIGETVEVENIMSENLAYNMEVEKGDKVILMIEKIDDVRQIHISDYSRNGMLIVLVTVFLGLLVLIGGKKGIKSVITISLTIFLIFKVLLPAILKGWNPLLMAIVISIIITIFTIIIVSGFCKKSYAAIIGTVSGVVIAGIIATVVGKTINLTGMSVDEASMLLYIPQQIQFNFRNLLFAGILLGALGAVMDIAMSIASSIQEIHKANNKLKRITLFNAGMSIGRDIMGTMSNTLILAYTGSSIPLLLILLAYETDFASLTNMDIIATEIVRSLAGSIGLILTIPITAMTAVLLIKKEKL